MARAVAIMVRVGHLEENAFHAGITQAFTVACSHYDQEINLEVMSLGFMPGSENSELDEIEKAVTPCNTPVLCLHLGTANHAYHASSSIQIIHA